MMATIPYAITRFDKTNFAITWAGMVPGDDAQPFEAATARLRSAHAIAGTGVSIRLSNEATFSIANAHNISFGNILIALSPDKARWIAPQVGTGTGTTTVIVMCTED
jgi:hypothetical protein